jgi:NADH-quinone oxidoreductase subunit I
MIRRFKDIAVGFNSLITGMRITLGQFFKPMVTVQYPHEALKMAERFRGHIELVRDPTTGKAVCFACKLCERACPSDCITVEGAKLDGAKKKSVTQYILDFTKCSLCGSCVEACRDGAIRFSREYNLASTNKDDYIMDLFKRLEHERLEAERAEGRVIPPSPPAPVAPASSPASSPVGQASPPAGSPGVSPGATSAPQAPLKPAEPTPSVTEGPKLQSPEVAVK